MDYNIDSIMGFAHSLIIAKQSIQFNVTPQVVLNLATNIYFTFPVTRQCGQTQQVPLYTIPHYFLGQVVGHKDISIFLFFPHLHG